MINFSSTVEHAFIICLPFSLFAFVSFWWKPRVWLHSLPPDIIQRAIPKTAAEKRLTKFLLLPIYLMILPGLSIASTWYIHQTTKTDISFLGAFQHIYVIWFIVHLWDFLVIDGVSMLMINPHHPPIPGTEGAKGWKDYGFHFRSLLRAVVMSLLFAIPAAAILGFLI